MSISGRMALLVTLFLVLVNIFNSVTANAPKAEGLTAVETWVVMCILHVFCVLSEYAIILKIIQTERRRIDRTRKRETHHNQLSSGLLLSSQSPQGTVFLCLANNELMPFSTSRSAPGTGKISQSERAKPWN